MKKLIVSFVFTTFLSFNFLFAQEAPISLVDKPTAGTLSKGSYSVNARLFEGGGLQNEIKVGISDRLMIGLGYGASGIIGSSKVDWYDYPGAFISYRVFDENEAFPALSLGFNSQGYGTYDNNKNRFYVKSTGFYAVASKNYYLLGNLGLHAGINKSLEDKDDDKTINLFCGIDKNINEELIVLAEYDFGLNDNKKSIKVDGNYLNLGVRWKISETFEFEFLLKDVLKNKSDNMVRELRLTFLNAY
ncbi:hypothetical protein IT568_10115 [bacterium]|nr:hypothetical protein [bacterium]